MKVKQMIQIVVVLATISFIAVSQTIPNGGFEKWDTGREKLIPGNWSSQISQ